MAADVKRLPCLRLILIGILFYMLIDLSSAQPFTGRSRFPSRWSPRMSLSQRSRSRFRPRTIRIQSPLRSEVTSSGFRPIRTQRTSAGRRMIQSQPIRGQRTFADRSMIRSQPTRSQGSFSDRNRVQPRSGSFQTPQLGEVRVPSVQRSRVPVRGNNQGPVQVMSRSQNSRQMQRIRPFNDGMVGRREQFRQQFLDSRQQQFPTRSASAAGGSRQPDFVRRQMSRQFHNLGTHRRMTELPRLSVSQNPQQPSFRVQQASTRRSHSRRVPATRQGELSRHPDSTNTVTKEQQSHVIVSQKQRQNIVSQQQTTVSRTQKQPLVVSRPQSKTAVSHRQQPMVLSRKQQKVIASKHHIPVVTNQQRKIITSQPQLPVVSNQKPQVIVSRPQLPVVSNQQSQAIIPQTQPQTIISHRKPEVQSPISQVGQTTGNLVVQSAGTLDGASSGTVVSQQGIVQNLLPVENVALQQGTIQYIPTVGNAVVQPAVTGPATTGTSDIVFEELVNAFTTALQNPSSQETQVVQTVPAAQQVHNMHPQSALQNAIHLQSQPVIHQHGGIMQHGGLMQHGAMMQHGAFGGHMHGNPFGFMNPWMMANMNPSMMQEMMFGDTTDPPDPVATTTTTTAAPVTVAAPVVDTNKTSTSVASSDTSASVSAATAVASATAASAAVNSAVEPVAVVNPIDATVTVVEPKGTNAVKTLDLVPVTTNDATVVLEVPKTDVRIAAKVIPKTVADVPSVPVPSQDRTKIPQHQNDTVVADTKTQILPVENTVPETTNAKSTMTFKEKLLAEVSAMLANTSIDMTLISKVVGQVASDLQGVAVESIPSAVQLGLKTLVPDPSAKKLSKKEIVSELIGSTRGVVVYPPTPPTVTVVQKPADTKPKVIVKTTHVDSHIQPSDVVKNVSSTNVPSDISVLNEKANATIPPITKIPTHIEMPTLPPKTGSMAESPEVYRTLQTILDHNPSAIVKVLEETAIPKVETPPGPKISVKSLVDTDPTSNLPNLQSILTDISTAGKAKSKNQNSSVTSLRKIEMNVEPLTDTLNSGKITNTSSTLAAEPKMKDIKLQPIIENSTLPTTTLYSAAETFSSDVPTMSTEAFSSAVPTMSAETFSSAVPTMSSETSSSAAPTMSAEAFSSAVPTVSSETFLADAPTMSADFLSSDITTTTTVATTNVTTPSVSSKHEGVPVNISKHVNTVPPKLANMEGIPVHIERVPTTAYPWSYESTSSVNLDATGALAILQEIRSFSPNSTSRKHDDIARKLSDPHFVDRLRGLLRTMMQKAHETTTTAPFWTEIPEVSTTNLPISSTEEYEAEDFITETPAP